MGLWDWMFGNGSNVPSDHREGGWHRAATPADPDQRKEILRYPDKSDVEFAKKYDAFYGTPADAYVNGTARVNVVTPGEYVANYELGGLGPNFQGSLPAAMVPNVQDQIAAAALAANRSPTAAVGFDPSVYHWEVDKSKNFNIGGYTPALYQGPNAYVYDAKQPKPKPKKEDDPPKRTAAVDPGEVFERAQPKPRTLNEYKSQWKDRIFVDADGGSRKDAIKSTATHEAAHRGMAKLDPSLRGTDNELAVRREMYKRFANPEELSIDYPDHYGPHDLIAAANRNGEKYDKIREHLDRLAQERVKMMRPMGPR